MSVDSSGELVVHDVQARLHWPKSEGGARILAHVQTAAVPPKMMSSRYIT